MASGLKFSSLRLVILALVIAQGDCQCLQNFDFPGGGFNQDHAIIYDISTCLRCAENTFTILVAGSGVSPAPLTNSTSGVTILPPSGSETEYTLMMPIPRDVLSNTADTIIGCTTNTNQEDIRFSELVFGDPVLTPSSTINVVEGTSGSLSCNPSPGTVSGIDARWTFGPTTLTTSTDNVIYSYTNIMRSQSGVYNCTLEHSIGSGSAPRYIVTRSAVVTINVQFPPEFTDGINSSCVGVGKSFSLLLNLEAQPDVGSNFSWTKDGVAYQGDVSATSLYISNVSLGDAGVYNVTASNFLGSDPYSFTLTVTRPPVFALGNDSQIITTNVSAGNNFAVDCTVRNTLPIDCSLTILLTTPQGNVTVTSNPVYTVPNIQSSFDYTCIADNGNFVSTLTFRISVLPTSSPTDVAPDQGVSITLIVGIVAGVAVLACVISILVPLLICCCLGVACFGSIGCLAKNKVKNGREMKAKMFI